MILPPKYVSDYVELLGATWCSSLGVTSDCEISSVTYSNELEEVIAKLGEAEGRDIAATRVESVLSALSVSVDRSFNDLAYWFYFAVREYYDLMSFEAASESVREFCIRVNALLETKAGEAFPKTGRDRGASSPRHIPLEEMWKSLRSEPKSCESTNDRKICKRDLGLLVIVNSLGYMTLHNYKSNTAYFRTREFDGEYIRSCLFGIWSNIAGLNELFGGGGPFMFETGAEQRGRILLVEGAYGNGKSTFAMSLAADFARKGGASWLVPFEQPARECAQVLRDFGILNRSSNAKIVVSRESTDIQSLSKNAEQGSVIILSTSKVSVDSVLIDAKLIGRTMKEAGGGCIVFDPLNAILDSDEYTSAERRAEFLHELDELRADGVTVILVGERTDQASIIDICEKIADTVIRLSSVESLGYQQRFLEIRKSRLQREQRGSHPFSIKGKGGIHIFPSSAAVAARTRQRNRLGGSIANRFGWPSVDAVLGEDPFCRGDCLILSGQPGTFKTQIALRFALCYGEKKAWGSKRKHKTIVFPLKDSKQDVEKALKDIMSKFSHEVNQENGYHVRSLENVSVVKLPKGYVQPGMILQSVEREIEKLRASGYTVDRVVFDNAEDWDLNCPFLTADPIFGATLVELLRRYSITTMFAMHANRSEAIMDPVENALYNAADVVLDLGVVEYRGAQRPIFRVNKTRTMNHASEYFDLYSNNGTLRVGNQSRLLQIRDGSVVGQVPVRLFLHKEGKLQQSYNKLIEQSLRPVLSSDVKETSGDRTLLLRSLGLSDFSTVDELQIVQIDEYQVADFIDKGERFSKLHGFSVDRLSSFERANKYGIGPTGDRFFAIPFIQNVGLIAYDHSEIGKGEVDSWERICELVWDRTKRANNDRQIFHFECDKDETYISFFLEVALGCGVNLPKRSTSIVTWLNSNREKLVLAFQRFALLGHRSHQRYRTMQMGGGFCYEALIYRQWFTTLCEMIAAAPDRDFGVKIATLPNERCVAGEWYLSVPYYSASPDVAFEIIRVLTAGEEQADRLNLGVGLPTSPVFYEGTQNKEGVLSCGYFDLDASDIGRCIENAGRRSNFENYTKINRRLAFHLKRFLEIEAIWIDEKRSSIGEFIEMVALDFADKGF